VVLEDEIAFAVREGGVGGVRTDNSYALWDGVG